MGSELALKSDPAPIVACTISRDVQKFDLLIDDMEAELGEAWGDLQLGEAKAFFEQPEANHLEFVAIAVDHEDEGDIGLIGEIIRAATQRRIKVILIADNVSTAGLHQLLKLGAHDFVPYPLPERALHEAIERVRLPEPEPVVASEGKGGGHLAKHRLEAPAALFAVQKLAGGAGATTLAVNLAYEFASLDKEAPSVCVIDLDLQSGTVSTFLDLPRREVITEMLADSASMDEDSFKQALQGFQDKMSVFTSPLEIVPLDMIGPEDVERIIEEAKAAFDVVVIDMPASIVTWTETVLNQADVFFAVMELDMRSAQNAMRFIKALQSEDLPLEKVNFVLNRAPRMTDLNGKGRVKRLTESLGVKISTQLADGGKQVLQCGDQGLPLAEMAKKNPLRKDIQKLAVSLHAAMLTDTAKTA
ncbi:AAA family ATPase [Rhodobacterales bacterium HKCCE2091]|nr:AAA family ATPase [Rhodobacterales bacterium HKCCE2091]